MSGNIVEVIGAVVDVEFPRDAVPAVYDALTVDNDDKLTLEVQAQLGDGVVRTIAMGASEGLKRGMGVENTGSPISVPVGAGTLGRIMDVLGTPIDMKGDVKCKNGRFTVMRLLMKSRHPPSIFWKLVSRWWI